ncbi:glycoside hydrolase/phage tail family protein [Shinella sp. BYT-45]|uniref:baseplate multidomain protein megatron n=1 Tax=Shinella sp. BYT-45 TaxID=3377377 RepID=UPI0039801D64
MATLLFQAAGAALGSVFGPLGAIVGRAAGALAGSAVDRALINGGRTVSGPRLADARVPGAEEGTAISRVYGTARVGGTLIWATRFEEQVITERGGGKASGPRTQTYRYFANIAVGLCEGPIAGVRRIWADGRELDLSALLVRVYTGAHTQPPDPLIEAKQGAGNTPAYRGLAYVVLERFPLDAYGNRIPVLHFEVVRPVGSLEGKIRAVTIIPGASEHGYDPRLVTEGSGAGSARHLNRNMVLSSTDWLAALSDLQGLCPNLERVALVVSWFGTDLRAGHCRIVPGVEARARGAETRPWSVAGLTRANAYLVSRSGGAAAYGGTPSDASVIAAIRDLKARGLEVYLYPFLMMDVPAGNGLPDPYGGPEQAVYPWRGRITCHPPSADRTDAARDQVAAFLGNAQAGHFSVSGESVAAPSGDEGFRRMILHYAWLAQAAGGVDGFLIGSEMRGLTWLRDGAGLFPFVEGLCDLAGDARAVLGPGTKITYAADWSEYSCFRPDDGSGEVRFHLDALWAHPAIDAVGIDNYMPLSDWQDGDTLAGNPDGFRHAEDAAGMRGMIARGEGFDWYYASDADRRARNRTPITDGAAGKPWVFRYKDIEGWWTNLHYDRAPGGAEMPAPTAWVPRSKPVWFTELGCPAIDKGANQPNTFVDMKSVENALPYHSGGARSDSTQRRFLDAHHDWWQGGGPEPGMVDPGRIFLWTWDARPYPAFPENVALWADGVNWPRGHWLNGRLGAATLADVIASILADHGFADFDVSGVAGDLPGFVQGEQASARGLLEPLMAAFQIDALEADGRLTFRSRLKAALPAADLDVLAERPGEALFEESRGHVSDLAGEAILDHFDETGAHPRVTTRSRRMAGDTDRVLRMSLPAVLHADAAAASVETALRDHRAGQRRVTFRLPPTALGFTPGDVVRLAGGAAGRFLITGITDGLVREVEARGIAAGDSGAPMPGGGGRPVNGAGPADAFAPVVAFLDLPVLGSGEPQDFACIAAYARPWRSMVVSSSEGTEGYRVRVRLDRPARIGWLAEPLGEGIVGRFDGNGAVVLDLPSGGLASADPVSVLNGANRIALRAGNGAWEIVGFRDASEIAPGRWRLSGLLRALCGTEDAMAAGHAAGAQAVVLDDAVRPLGLDVEEVGRPSNWVVDAVGVSEAQAGPFAFAGGLRALTPLSPVHLRARRGADGIARFSWVRRGRIDSDSWLAAEIPLDEPSEAYRLDILSGGTVVRSVETGAPSYAYPAADELADFGAPQATIAIRVRQLGRAVPLGLPAEATLNL